MRDTIHKKPGRSGGLFGATLGAAAAGATLVVMFWMPAEYGIDPTGGGGVLGLTNMGEAKQRLEAEQNMGTDPMLAEVLARLDRIEALLAADQPPVEVVDGWRDSFSYALAPGQGFEVKLTMEAGQVAGFEWQADGAVYVDMHGDSASQEHSYAIQDSSLADDGTLTAAFTGSHGWYWRNRTDQTVTVALQTRGDYGRMLHP